jgi:hypothetical protein
MGFVDGVFLRQCIQVLEKNRQGASYDKH